MVIDFDSIINKDVHVITTKLPSYLETFIKDNNDIVLVYAKHDTVSTNDLTVVPEEEVNCKEEETSKLDLTGSPLKVDLNSDDTLIITGITEAPPSWSIEEAKHYPLILMNARRFLVQYNKRKDKLPLPVYCICDGNDPKNTVCIGTHLLDKKLTNVAVYVLGVFNESDEMITIPYMEKEHKKTFRISSTVDCVSKSLYNIVGYKLRNCDNLHQSQFNGSVSMEITSNGASLELQPTIVKNIIMTLQVIVGHKNSKLYSIWQQLCQLNKYINILEDTKKFDGETITVSDDPLDSSDIQDAICDCFKMVIYEAKKSNFDLKQLRHETILDKLYKILNRCETLSVLRDCFHLIFEELANTEFKVQIPTSSTLVVVDILNGIINGNIAVPTLNFKQSLELLLELGFEHLKNDYMAITNHFYLLPQEGIINEWNDLCNEKVDIELKRKSRITLCQGNSTVTNPEGNSKKFLFLYRLHIILEYLFLIEECGLSEDSIENLCTKLCSVYIENTSKKVFKFKREELCDISFHLNRMDGDAKSLENKSPQLSTIQMTSHTKYSKVISVFQVSKCITFPSVIYDSFSLSGNVVDSQVYLSKMVMTVEKI